MGAASPRVSSNLPRTCLGAFHNTPTARSLVLHRDAADAAWDIWYGQARSFAKGELAGGPVAMASASSEFVNTVLLAFPGAPKGYFTGSASDDYTIESLLEHAKQMLYIHSTKPKFKALLTGDGTSAARAVLTDVLTNTIVPLAQGLGTSATAAPERRRYALALLAQAVTVGVIIGSSGAAQGTATSMLPFPLDATSLANTACSPSSDMLLRDACLAALKNAAGPDGFGNAPVIAACLLRAAREPEPMVTAWNLGALLHSRIIAAVVSRVDSARAAARSSSATTSHAAGVAGDKGGPQPPPYSQFVCDVLASLYQATADARSFCQASGLTASQGTTPEWSVDAPRAELGLVTVLAACDTADHGQAPVVLFAPPEASDSRIPARARAMMQAAQVYARPAVQGAQGGFQGAPGPANGSGASPGADAAAVPCVWDKGGSDGRGGVRIHAVPAGELASLLEDGEWERPQEWLDVARAMLEQRPGALGVLRLMLAHPTEATLATLNAVSEILAPVAWESVVLPFIRTRLRGMGDAVSGSQFEQDTVLLLREAMRVWYTNDDSSRRPSLQLASSLWHTLLLAMKHGYTETERFPEIASRMLRWHGLAATGGSDSSQVLAALEQWARAAVSVQVAGRSHKVARAMVEVLFVAMGIESSAWGTEEMVEGGMPEQAVGAILSALGTSHSPASHFAWRELCYNYPTFLLAHPGAVSSLLQSIRAAVDATVSHRLAAAGLPIADAPPPPSKGGTIAVGLDAAAMDPAALQSTLDLLSELALVVKPTHAPQVFLAALKIMSLLPTSQEVGDVDHTVHRAAVPIVAASSYRGNRTGPALTGDSAVDSGATLAAGSGYATDEALAVVVDKLPSGSCLPPGALHEALAVAGVQTRCALARLLPAACLTDASPIVRLAALTALASGQGAAAAAIAAPAVQIRVLQAIGPDRSDVDEGLWADATLASLMPFAASLDTIAALQASSGKISRSGAQAGTVSAETMTATGAGGIAIRSGVDASAVASAATHTVTATVAPVADLDMYELRLLVAAAPVLAGIAVTAAAGVGEGGKGHAGALAVLTAAIGRLLRGARVSIEATELTTVHPDIARAMTQIATACPLPILRSFATSPAGCRRLGDLARAVPEWAMLLRNWVQQGVVVRRLAGGHTAGMEGMGVGTPRTRSLSSLAEDVPEFVTPSAPPAEQEEPMGDGEQDGLLAHAEPSAFMTGDTAAGARARLGSLRATGRGDSRQLLTEAIDAAVAAGQWLVAVRLAGQMKRGQPAVYASCHMAERLEGELLPGLRRAVVPDLPMAAVDTPRATVERYDELVALRTELTTLLGPVLVENGLGLEEVLGKLQRARVVQLVRDEGAGAARAWMTERGVRNPSLFLYVDAAARGAGPEEQPATPADAEEGDPIMQPSPVKAQPASVAGSGVDLLGSSYTQPPTRAASDSSSDVWGQLASLRATGAEAAHATAPPPASAPAALPTPAPSMVQDEGASAEFDILVALPVAPAHRVELPPMQARSQQAPRQPVAATPHK